MWTELRTADGDAARGTVAALAAIVTAVRQRCPHARITVRGDRGFAREVLMAWCELHDVFYLLGLARNARLLELLAPALVRARGRAMLCGHTREFADLKYRTLDSWSREWRVVGKDNPRFIVTNLPAQAEPAPFSETSPPIDPGPGESAENPPENGRWPRPERRRAKIRGIFQPTKKPVIDPG